MIELLVKQPEAKQVLTLKQLIGKSTHSIIETHGILKLRRQN